MGPRAEDEAGQGIEELLARAVAQVVEHEDPQAFDGWWAAEAPRFLAGLGLREAPPDTAQRLLALLGRGIWNVIPLPSQGFRPAPRPLPHDHEPCLCGSGEAFASCCGQLHPVPTIPAEAVWPAVAAHAPLDLLQRLEVLPGDVLGDVASRLVEAGRTAQALEALERAFARERQCPGADAVDLYVDLVTQTRGPAAGAALVDDLLTRVDAPSRAALWSRKGGEALVAGDDAGARRCLESGRQDDPENVGLLAVELSLLAREGRFEEVAKRARSWRGRLRPLLASGEAEDLRELLETAITNPRALGREQAAGPAEASRGPSALHRALLAVLEAGLARPARACLLVVKEGHASLSNDEAIRRAEAAWHTFWARRDPQGRSPVTESEVEDLLQGTPELFDSLDVLHALAEIAEELERQGVATPALRLVDRLFERGEEILRRGLAGAPSGLDLPWSAPENRAALELLADSARRHERAGRREAARACAATLVALDPADTLAARELLARVPAPSRRPGSDSRRRRGSRRR